MPVFRTTLRPPQTMFHPKSYWYRPVYDLPVIGWNGPQMIGGVPTTSADIVADMMNTNPNGILAWTPHGSGNWTSTTLLTSNHINDSYNYSSYGFNRRYITKTSFAGSISNSSDTDLQDKLYGRLTPTDGDLLAEDSNAYRQTATNSDGHIHCLDRRHEMFTSGINFLGDGTNTIATICNTSRRSVFPPNANGLNPSQPAGESAIKSPYEGTVIWKHEIDSGYIPHMLSTSCHNARDSVYTWPARNTDGVPDGFNLGGIIFVGCNYLCQGMVFRLRASFDIESQDVPEPCKVIMRAMKTFGVIVGDKNGLQRANPFLGFADPTWPVTPGQPDYWGYPQFLHATERPFPVNNGLGWGIDYARDLEFVDMSSVMVDPDSSEAIF